jgi:hypothetical protein
MLSDFDYSRGCEHTSMAADRSDLAPFERSGLGFWSERSSVMKQTQLPVSDPV